MREWAGAEPRAWVRAASGAGVGLAALWGARLLRLAIRRFPKGNEGKRVSSGYNRRRRLATRSSGKQQAERTAVRTAPIVCPEESPLVRPQAHSFCRRGLTRRLRRGSGTCSPKGRSYFSFDGERKVCKRKPAARRYGKKAPIAHFDGGPFSLRCLSPPCPGAVGGGHTQPLRLGMRRRKLNTCATPKGQREIQSTLAFSASHEACRRMAVFAVQLAGSHTRPASREARRRAAVKPRSTRMSPYAPCAAKPRSPGSRGTTPG